MTEPRIRPERFTTQPGEVRLGKLDAAGRWRPLTVAEAREDGVTDYDPKTGKVGTAPDRRGGGVEVNRATRGRSVDLGPRPCPSA